MKVLNVYRQDYDLISFESLISEDKLDDFIDFFIEKELNYSKVKFKVTNIKKHHSLVNIYVTYDSYVIGDQEFSMKNDVIGFQYQIIELDKINNF